MPILKQIICIDGAAATGKTSLATQLAADFNYGLFDSGSLYRAFAYHLLTNQVELQPRQVFLAFETFKPVITRQGEIFLNKRSVMEHLRSQAVTDLVPLIGGAFFVRKRIRQIQRDFARSLEGKVIFTGRDTGDEVFPESCYKFFLIASAEVRAQRRLPEIQLTNPTATYESVLADLKERDRKDESRVVSPMRKPEEAYVIDTSKMEPAETVAEVKRVIAEKQTTIEGQRRLSKEVARI